MMLRAGSGMVLFGSVPVRFSGAWLGKVWYGKVR